MAYSIEPALHNYIDKKETSKINILIIYNERSLMTRPGSLSSFYTVIPAMSQFGQYLEISANDKRPYIIYQLCRDLFLIELFCRSNR